MLNAQTRPDSAPNIVPVILAGGKGTRLWPASREARPKPFLKLEDDRSLLQNTVLRAASVASECVLIATNEAYRFQVDEDVASVRDQLHGIDIRYQLEPEARNTAPAVCVSARYARELFGEAAVLLVLPSDHVISDPGAFRLAVASAIASASTGDLVALGVEPRGAETAFGYMQCEHRSGAGRARRVTRFIEKPCRQDAERFAGDGRHLWNSGIFCGSVSACLQAFARHAPEIHANAERCWRSRTRADGRNPGFRPGTADFLRMPDISIDHALMEQAGNLLAVETDMGWTDVGSWQAMTDLVAPDAAGNRILGNAVLVDTHNTYVQTDGRLVAAVGVDDLVIVDTADAVLIGSLKDAQKVGLVVERLQAMKHEARTLHRTVHRPWGTYTVVEEGKHYKIKRLCVKPGEALSLQVHRYRSEHWVLVEGRARVINGEREFTLEQDQSTYIPAGNRHRLENTGQEPVVVVETQTGFYLGEDDILRLEDDYGRATASPAHAPAGNDAPAPRPTSLPGTGSISGGLH